MHLLLYYTTVIGSNTSHWEFEIHGALSVVSCTRQIWNSVTTNWSTQTMVTYGYITRKMTDDWTVCRFIWLTVVMEIQKLLMTTTNRRYCLNLMNPVKKSIQASLQRTTKQKTKVKRIWWINHLFTVYIVLFHCEFLFTATIARKLVLLH